MRTIFLLSFRQRDELAAAVSRGGWRTVAARRRDGLDRRVAASAARVVLIDARGAADEGLEATRMIAAAAAAAGRALLVLVSRGDAALLDAFHDAGATQFLASPMREAELHAAIRFAERYADRVSGGGQVAEESAPEPLGWRYDRRQRSLQLTPTLRDVLQVPAGSTASAVLRGLPSDLRPLLALSLRRLGMEGATAFAHDLPGIGRVVQHLQRDPRTGRIHALVEPLGAAPDASAALRELFPRRTRSLVALAQDLPAALAAGEVEVLFQPQVSLASDTITGVEALARWRHARLGEVGAAALLAAAAHAGQSVVLSAYLQERAFALAAAWPPALAGLRVAINVTAEDLATTNFATTLLARIDAAGLQRSRVTVEVTESGLIENRVEAASVLSALRAAGCRTAIDDFGTGYSSLSYLSALPLDYLKLDKSMTQALEGGERERIVALSVLELARSLGLGVVAEGVETEAQRLLLAAEGCELYQGWLCAPPLDSAALCALVQAA
ncbi:EAL domain, c-di-GMP-specific phosphodiesterase class I (or its enzymatically inactive variant) [Sphingomonas guangdongensis]|uniref:EAL domain, c-di-GMP-specific phosphodiesterase class I (Or its enzymatically inactive variant) n=2 Tax=Sphingomonas guangdongensis TaxID=1141890 RepID=A0A285QYG0_9SPHN|nr:EAL domain, c-di-GMP-specific phosphodiesterase class I (or its enzymatically inactive variant) [Sphingomonas guangdongensis]